MARPGLILDRDGVVNIDTNFLHRIEDCRFLPGIFDVVRHFRAHGFALAVATNQSGIGRGFYSEAQFHTLMDWMDMRFAEETGQGFDRVYFCPHHPAEGLDAYKLDCDCRKPLPGMFRQAVADLDLDPMLSWTIGDNPRDLAAGKAAGIASRVLLAPDASTVSHDGDHWVVPRLTDVITLHNIAAA